MSEIPFNPDNIDGQTKLGIETLDTYDSREIEETERAVLKVPNGGEIYSGELGPCIAYVGYDKTNRVIFGEHFILDRNLVGDLRSFQESLRSSGINITEDALAGGNQTYGDERKLGTEAIDEGNATKSELVSFAERNFFDANRLQESARFDTISVRFQNGKFAINHEVGESEEPRGVDYE